MIIYGDDISEIINNMIEREEAIVIYEGNIYSELTHQECVVNNMDVFFEARGLTNIFKDEDEYVAAEEITDTQFKTCDMTGYDLFGDIKHSEDVTFYLVAHYPQNIEHDYPLVKKYADENGYILATFCDEEQYQPEGAECRIVLGVN